MNDRRAPVRIDVRDRPGDAPEWVEVCRHLREGGLIAYPTETVYGFGCTLRDDALRRLASLKRRPADQPFLVLTPSRKRIADLRWTKRARALADVFWPGPLTLVLADPEGHYPGRVRGSTGGVAVRRTPHPTASILVERLGDLLTSTSANEPDVAPARTADEAERALRALGGDPARVWILDGGALSASRPSTIVDCTDEERAVVVREGAIPSRRLEETVRTSS